MENVFTLAELVKKYGSKAQKETLKKMGNLTGKEFNILLKSVDTEWESYEIEGRGSKRIITCNGKRSKKEDRTDNRSNNGQGQLVGEFELNSLVVNYLVQNNNNVNPMSLTKWLIDLGIVDGKLTGTIYGSRVGHLEEIQNQFCKLIKGYHKTENDIEILDEFIQVSLKNMKTNLVSVFNKLAKAKVIIYQKERWGCTTKNNYRKLTRSEIKEIASIRRLLLTKYGLKSNDLYKSKKKEVKVFKKEFEEQLSERLNLKFDYDAHFCVLQDSDLGVHEYLLKLREKGDLDFTFGLTEEFVFSMAQVYKEKYSERSLELAKRREKNTSNRSDSDRVKALKIMKQYAPIWELLLEYFRCTSCLNSNKSKLVADAPNTMNLEVFDSQRRVS